MLVIIDHTHAFEISKNHPLSLWSPSNQARSDPSASGDKPALRFLTRDFDKGPCTGQSLGLVSLRGTRQGRLPVFAQTPLLDKAGTRPGQERPPPRNPLPRLSWQVWSALANPSSTQQRSAVGLFPWLACLVFRAPYRTPSESWAAVHHLLACGQPRSSKDFCQRGQGVVGRLEAVALNRGERKDLGTIFW